MNTSRNLLIIGKVWPEPKSSAAGTRMMQLINFFLDENYTITFASTANFSDYQEDLKSIGVQCEEIALNDDSFNSFIQQLNPTMVMFDRFMTEEQFGWRVVEQCPSAIRILNTEDLHFVRKARESAIKSGGELDLFTNEAKREIASIYRCDLTLLVSETELNLLVESFQVPIDILYYLPLFAEVYKESDVAYNEREGFLFIGNFLHSPNVDAVQYLKHDIWPLIRKKLPGVEVSICGAYVPQKIENLHNEKEGFIVKGRIKNVVEMTMNSRVVLAPLRFGSGIKGKLLESMAFGTPNVTTSVGAEDMSHDGIWNGYISDDPVSFANAAVSLYTNESEWTKQRLNGFQILESRYNPIIAMEKFSKALIKLESSIEVHRKTQFTSQLIQHHTIQSSMYMSKWIMEKNK